MRTPFSAGVLAAALVWPVRPDLAYQASQPPADSYEYEGHALTADQKLGRDTWYLDRRQSEVLAQNGGHDVRQRRSADVRRLAEPRRRFERSRRHQPSGCKAAREPDRYGLWMDDCSAAEPVSRMPGLPAGIVGLRRFDNPAFDAAKWNLQAYLADRRLSRRI